MPVWRSLLVERPDRAGAFGQRRVPGLAASGNLHFPALPLVARPILRSPHRTLTGRKLGRVGYHCSRTRNGVPHESPLPTQIAQEGPLAAASITLLTTIPKVVPRQNSESQLNQAFKERIVSVGFDQTADV